MLRLSKLITVTFLLVFLIVTLPLPSSAQISPDARAIIECIERRLNRALEEEKTKLPPPKIKLASISDGSTRAQLHIRDKTEPSVSFFAAVPKDKCTFEMVFGSEPSEANLSKLKQYQEAAKRLNAQLASDRDAQKGLAAFVSKERSRFIVVIGHNAGGWFWFPDGTAMSVLEIAALCQKNGKRCVLLSCEAGKFINDTGGHIGVEKVLTYEEAFGMAQELVQFFRDNASRGQQVSYMDIGTALDAYQSRRQFKAKVLMATAATATVGAGAAVVIVSGPHNTPAVPEDDNKSEKTRKAQPKRDGKRGKIR